MAEGGSEFKSMSLSAIGLVLLAITSVVGIIVLQGFKNTEIGGSQNTTLDLFIAGLAIFGTFSTVIALVLVGKVIIRLIRAGM